MSFFKVNILFQVSFVFFIVHILEFFLLKVVVGWKLFLLEVVVVVVWKFFMLNVVVVVGWKFFLIPQLLKLRIESIVVVFKPNIFGSVVVTQINLIIRSVGVGNLLKFRFFHEIMIHIMLITLHELLLIKLLQKPVAVVVVVVASRNIITKVSLMLS